MIHLIFFLLSTYILSVTSLPTSSTKHNLPGRFVPYSQLSTCPSLPHKDPPKNAKDVRPDDFKVIMAMGDSITAGLLARGSRNDLVSSIQIQEAAATGMGIGIGVGIGTDKQYHFEIEGKEDYLRKIIPEIAEWRGLSYSIGSDDDSITIPNILKHYNRNVSGTSTGHHSPISCLGTGWDIGCSNHPKEDGLNAAISGSLSAGLMSQVKDYLIPQILELQLEDKDWKYVNLGIGANDVCAFCLTPNATAFPLSGTPKQFASNIKDAINELRKHVPNMIVNIIGLFKVSDIYELTMKDPYCQPPYIPIPNLALECSCALLPGPAGDFTRSKMDELGENYDLAVLEIIKEWEDENDPSFGAVWQPGTAIDLINYPPESLSKIDCFHPSELSHQRVATGFWNRLTLNMEEKYTPIPWEDDPSVRCLKADDRIQVGQVTEYLKRGIK
ncbi:uncharacterized protein IL334_000133 [Kwoniella shivajii]|uniref:SGNH hydrolase-type esterase domain-containing protein n=1 Tax=Kwoniella shivajii TaxID=564305 RepID=A0ABZ1CPU7_9TREE|nr:hypothetical protein IL334_000133 [Kwoniella shivajii]